jgi:hypothetical protein
MDLMLIRWFSTEVHATNRVEAFAKMLLYSMRIPRLREDAKKLVIRKEVEAREGCTLRFKVRLELLLDLIKGFVGPLKLIQ